MRNAPGVDARLLPATLVLFAAFLGTAMAADDVDCSDAVTQQDMNYCADQDFEAADAELNSVWKDARAAAKDTDAEQSDDQKGAEAALLAAERGWIAYRDGQCTLAGFEARGGSMEPMLVSACKADMTRKRIQELNDYISGPAQ